MHSTMNQIWSSLFEMSMLSQVFCTFHGIFKFSTTGWDKANFWAFYGILKFSTIDWDQVDQVWGMILEL